MKRHNIAHTSKFLMVVRSDPWNERIEKIWHNLTSDDESLLVKTVQFAQN
jgi:hypothetical protein